MNTNDPCPHLLGALKALEDVEVARGEPSAEAWRKSSYELLLKQISYCTPEQKRALFFELAPEVLPGVDRDEVSGQGHFRNNGGTVWVYESYWPDVTINKSGDDVPGNLRATAACCLAAAAELERGDV